MKMLIKKKTTISKSDNLIILANRKSTLSTFGLSKKELDYINNTTKKKKELVSINQYDRHIFVLVPKQEKNANKHAEKCRMLGDQLAKKLKDMNSALIIDVKESQTEVMQIAEGIALSNYTFTKHKTKKRPNKLTTIYLCKKSDQKAITELQNIIDAVYFTRDLINEPFSHLKAKDLAKANSSII